jgi:DNA-binding transcriptional LysR family regulator
VEIRYLRSFIEVAQSGHVGRAAEALGIAQPSLSYQIARLEESLGEPLFLRTSRGVELTPAGHALYDEVGAILKRVDGLEARVHAAARGHSGVLTIGLVSGAFLSGVASRVIRDYRSRYPNVLLRVRAALHAPLVQMLADGEVDLAVFGSALGHSDLVGTPLMRETFVVALPAGHRLRSRKSVRYRDLSGDGLIILSRESSPTLFTHTLAVCAKHGYEPGSIDEACGEDAVIGMVAAGSGVAVIPDSWGAIRIPGVIVRSLTPGGDGLTLRLFRRSQNASALVHAFFECAGD